MHGVGDPFQYLLLTALSIANVGRLAGSDPIPVSEGPVVPVVQLHANEFRAPDGCW